VIASVVIASVVITSVVIASVVITNDAARDRRSKEPLSPVLALP
jgi:hypothetical protein